MQIEFHRFDRPEFGAFHLSGVDYKKLLDLWVAKGRKVGTGDDNCEGQELRRHILRKLSETKTKGIIEAGITRPTEEERDDLRYLLDEANGDPLMLLNLAGVPPLMILDDLEGISMGNAIHDAADRKLASESHDICARLDLLARDFDMLGPFMERCLSQIDLRARVRKIPAKYGGKDGRQYDVPKEFTPSDHLRVYKAILKNRKDFMWFPPARSKGRQPSRALNGMIYSLYERILFFLRQRIRYPSDELKLRFSRIAARSVDGLVAALVYSVSPQLVRSTSPDESAQGLIRTVRRVYKSCERWLIETKEDIVSLEPVQNSFSR